MEEIRKTVEISITPTPLELANLFCAMDGDEQSIFFSEIANDVKTWDGTFEFQMQSVTDSKHLTNEARRIMRTIGDYSSKTF